MPRPRSETLAMIWRCARHQDPDIPVEYLPYGTSEDVRTGSESLQPSDRGVTGAYRELTQAFWE